MPNSTSRCHPLPQSGAAPAIDESVWYAKGLRFECAQCGNCCGGVPGYVWLTDEDMQRIADYLKQTLETFTRTYVRRVTGAASKGRTSYSLTEKFNYDCTFLTRDKDGKSGCMIYSVRPMQCRTWPFWDANLARPESWRRAAANCPGMCAAEGPVHELAHMEQCRQHPESPHY